MGSFNILTYFNNRKKYYKDIANATIIKSIVLTIVQLSVGFIHSPSDVDVTVLCPKGKYADLLTKNGIKVHSRP